MKDYYTLKQETRNELRGFWTQPVLATLVLMLISSFCSAFNYIGIEFSHFGVGYNHFGIGFVLLLLVFVPLELGYTVAMYDFMHGSKLDTIERMFSCFKQYGRTLALSLLKYVYIFLWTLLLIVPGIVKYYSYAMAYYISKENPDMRPEECINASMRMMHGYKGRLFLLDLSFIGWFLLSILTFGILFLWVMPWVWATHAKFYEELKAMNATDNNAANGWYTTNTNVN